MRPTEREILDHVSTVPPVPEDLFGRIESRIRRNRTHRALLYATAATLVLSAGAVFFPRQHPRITESSEQLLQEELLGVSSFLNGGSTDDDMSVYVAVDMDPLEGLQ